MSFQMPSSRYILPSFVERTSYGMKESNPYNKLFEERIIFLGVQIDDASANDVMAQLLTLESTDPDRDITIYINSPGGSFTSLMAIYDTMMFVRPDIQTVCMGQAASAAAVLLAAGTPGKRLALPVLAGADPPAVGRVRWSGLRPGDPRRRDPAGAVADGGDPGPAHRPDPRPGPHRHRARQDPHGPGVRRPTGSSTRSSRAGSSTHCPPFRPDRCVGPRSCACDLGPYRRKLVVRSRDRSHRRPVGTRSARAGQNRVSHCPATSARQVTFDERPIPGQRAGRKCLAGSQKDAAEQGTAARIDTQMSCTASYRAPAITRWRSARGTNR